MQGTRPYLADANIGWKSMIHIDNMANKWFFLQFISGILLFYFSGVALIVEILHKLF